ncbi:hypothetical protein P153DRAFT_400973 [Dothidotthia symphoricarpi CBS 119687]|uniref:DUF4470 domain-containing protein n=1 Tax=Dothidotthia symphoricarpi CBS 119687 TaxID=1392245 RepID=A0A6A5ZZL6_9PLEO|nr:uncharacterized protein P153DRAFT_400973 [Dothidotthia symphoricarpi CBS 119687]KAF2124344.1 hypothetical protein P153DRAFT_400973 [Dothidotthia symphoricarpi CBS 119687]
MSLKTAPITQAPFFYPAGNTPAVCLTQSLPPEQDAALLLLGCGDIRNILFTVYGGVGLGGRTLDFTCCDIEAETIARNVLILTLILDDVKGVHIQQIWNVYYHVFIDADSLALLQGQAEKLLGHAASLDIWHSSPYGKNIRFCDSTTFRNVVKLWKLYAIDVSDQPRYTKVQKIVKGQWEAAKRYKRVVVPGYGPGLKGHHSVAPLLLAGLSEGPKQHRVYWASGTCLEDKKAIQKLTVANPMFICRSGLILHSGNDPLRGFHLSILYSRLAAGLPITNPDATTTSAKALPKGLKTALTELASWCEALRDAAAQVTIRYVNSDAIAFCHTLRHHRTNGESQSAHWYRASWKYESLVLDTADYKLNGHAPTTFDVIDTSNLIDYLGSLNLLVATAPLLTPKPTSTLRTEMLVPRESNVTGSAKTLLSGDLPTVALLLGLKPVQYWTNATATWNPNDPFLEDIPDGKIISHVLSRQIILWKTANISHIRYNPVELAKFMFNVYLEMFQDENETRLLETLATKDQGLLKKLSFLDLYTRASLAVILRYLRETEVVDWHPFITQLTKLIRTDRNLVTGLHHFHSLLVHFDLFGISALEQPPSFQHDLARGPFRNWKEMPTTVCLTLVVPHAVVAAFGNINNGNGTPLCYLQTQSSISMGQSNYPDVQLGFGTVTTSGTPYTDDYTISVKDDPTGYNGKSPLIISAMVSTLALTELGDPACGVGFFLKSTLPNLQKFIFTYGMFLELYTSSVGRKDVFVTRHRPNMTGHISMQCKSSLATGNDDDITVAIRPFFDTAATKIVSLQIRYDIESSIARLPLQNAEAVIIEPSNPFTLALNIGDIYCKKLELPLPLDNDCGKTRISVNALWVDYTAPVAEPERLALRADSMFPVKTDHGLQLSLEHLHYVHPDVLPKVYIGRSNSDAHWVAMLTSLPAIMSETERAEFERATTSDITVNTGRVGLKKSISAMHREVFGIQSMAKAVIFGLRDSSRDFATLYVDAVRLDVSNQTIFMDAALVQHGDHLGPEFSRANADTGDITDVTLQTDINEAAFWKHLLPAFAERCRTWKHKPTCEYRGGKMPLSTESNKRYMCSCGDGVFPDGYLKNIKQFKAMSNHAVRVAIPVIYTSPISNHEPVPASLLFRTFGRLHMQQLGSRILRSCCNLASGCKFAQYYSASCQTKDWKEGHKQICKQLKQIQ